MPILSIGAINDEASNLIKKNQFGIASNNSAEISEFIQDIVNNDFKFNLQNRNKFEGIFKLIYWRKVLADALKL